MMKKIILACHIVHNKQENSLEEMKNILLDVFGFALQKKCRVKNVSLWICFEDLGAYMTFYKFKL